jgi:flagellar motility protein MotE (MotC chaperone)
MGTAKFYTLILVAVLCLTGTLVWDFGTFTNLPAAYAQDKDETEGEDKETPTEEGDTEESPCPECPECPDPAKVVLRGLEEKKLAITSAGKILDQERKELETYEEQIDEKLAALAALKKQINDDMDRLDRKKTQKELEADAAFEAKMARLVKMYAGMKPKAAALIVDKMELEVAQEIFIRMREASASQILAFVDSAKAAKISERLAFKKN